MHKVVHNAIPATLSDHDAGRVPIDMTCMVDMIVGDEILSADVLGPRAIASSDFGFSDDDAKP